MPNRYFTIVNKHLLLNDVDTFTEPNIAFNIILNTITDYLMMMKGNVIHVNISKLSFEHLMCVEYSGGDIFNVYKFNPLTCKFHDVDNLGYEYGSAYHYKILKGLLNINLHQLDSVILDNVINPPQSHISKRPHKHVEPVIISPQSPIKESPPDVDGSPEKLLEMIALLEKQKLQEQNRLEKLKLNTEENQKRLVDLSDNLGDEKRKFQKNKEREEENKNIFRADKKAYYLLKQDIKTGKLLENKISILFQEKYPVFKFMDDKDLLESDDAYFLYMNMFNELYPKNPAKPEPYVPHNIHYLTEIEQQKYEDIKTDTKDLVDEFMEKQKIKPLDEILEDIDNIPDDNEHMFGDVSFDL